MNRHRQEPGPENLVVAARAAGVTDPRVLEAIRRTLRAAFVPPGYATRAYDDAPIPIPHHQVTTQPSALTSGRTWPGGRAATWPRKTSAMSWS